MSDRIGNTSYGYPSSRHYPDEPEKCVSLTDDILDSGIGSITLSDIEQNRFLDEHLQSIPDEGIDSLRESEKSKEKDGTQVDDKTDEERLDSEAGKDPGIESITPQDDLYEPYIPHLDGFSPLHFAIIDKDVEKALDMITDCPESAALDFFTKEVHTSLHLAVYSNLPEVVRFLVIYGANFRAKDQRGNTPLHTACELGRHSCVQTLLTPLDSIETLGCQKLRIPQDINEKNYEGLTPLHLATINNQSQIVKLLVQQPDINVNIGDSTSGRTALHHALERRNKDCFMQILKGSVNVNATTYDGCSPLHIAVGLELVQETKYLVTRGADIGIETTDEVLAWDLAHSPAIRNALQYSMLPMLNRGVKQR